MDDKRIKVQGKETPGNAQTLRDALAGAAQFEQAHVERLGEALKTAEASFRNIVTRSAEGIVVVDRNDIVRFVNPTAESILDRQSDELLDEVFGFPVTPGGTAELDIIRADGAPGIGEMRVVGTEWEGENAYLVSIRDITERRWVEEEIIAKNRDLETLLYVISHDLKEPLRAIENFSQMVHDRYAERLDEKGQDFLMRVVRGAERLHQLLDDILMLSRAQRMGAPTEEVDGEIVVKEALRRLEASVKRTGANVQISPNLPRLRADKIWATEAVYNLIANALKFTREGARPDVEIQPYQPRPGEPRGVGIVVRDRGPGVAPNQAEQIFQLFYRSVGREIEGTGAGLAIVRQIAQRHGGRAWVRQPEGMGSEFIITFGLPGGQK